MNNFRYSLARTLARLFSKRIREIPLPRRQLRICDIVIRRSAVVVIGRIGIARGSIAGRKVRARSIDRRHRPARKSVRCRPTALVWCRWCDTQRRGNRTVHAARLLRLTATLANRLGVWVSRNHDAGFLPNSLRQQASTVYAWNRRIELPELRI